MGGEKVLVGLRGLKIFQSRFGSFFGSFFAFFKPFFVSIQKFFGGSFVLHACRPKFTPLLYLPDDRGLKGLLRNKVFYPEKRRLKPQCDRHCAIAGVMAEGVTKAPGHCTREGEKIRLGHIGIPASFRRFTFRVEAEASDLPDLCSCIRSTATSKQRSKQRVVSPPQTERGIFGPKPACL